MRKIEVRDPVGRVGQSLVYYDQLDSMVDKCRSMQGVKGIDGTVIFADRLTAKAEDGFAGNCHMGVVLKPEELDFSDKGEVAPVLIGAMSKALSEYGVDLQWPCKLKKDGRDFGRLACVISKIKDRWVYVLVILDLYFDEAWDQESRESFLQAVIHGLDHGDQAMRKGELDSEFAAYVEATGLMNRAVRASEGHRVLEGKVVEIDKKGDLLIKPEKGRASKAAGKKVKTIEYLDVASE